MRNTGLYISWITGKEDIVDIDEFEGNSVGSTSMYFTCELRNRKYLLVRI